MSWPLDETMRLQRIEEALRTRYWSWTFLSHDECPATLMDVLRVRLPHIDKDSWPERFNFGGIYINGRAAYTDSPLPVPCRIEYYEPKFEIRDAATLFPQCTEELIVYHDEHIAVAYKPPRLSSMPAKEQRHFSLKHSIEKIFNTRIHMPSRLDVSAQGLIIVSLSTAAHAPLQQAFEARQVTKKYLCATDTPCSWTTQHVTLPISRDPLHPVLRSTRAPGGQTAETIFSNLGRTLSGDRHVQVVCAQPVTGRTHQIRVHAASLGIPLAGDLFYDGAEAPYLHLVSSLIECKHPVSGAPMRFIIPDRLRHDWIKRSIGALPM